MAFDKRLYVYIIKCADSSYYTGVTNNIAKRIAENNEGIDAKSYTYNRRPVELVFVEVFQNFEQAILFEKQIKGWSRKKKEALIEQNWGELQLLAACKNPTMHKRNRDTEV